MQTYRLLIVDDDDLVRAGLYYLLSNKLAGKVIAEVGEIESAATVIKQTRIHIVLARNNIKNILPFMEMIKAEHSETRVMLLLDQEHEFWNALQLNADGYELRELIPFQLAVAIKTIGEGYTWIGGKLSSYLLKGDNREHLISLSQRESSKSVIACLSIREREVISLLSEGLNTTQIADKMAISPKTVKLYITNCIKKLNVENRSQAIVKFLQAKPTTTAS